MTNFFLIALAHAVVTFAVLLVWLARTHLKHKGKLRVLTDIVQKNDKDIAGLYSSALAADNRLTMADEQLRALLAKISSFQQNEQTANPYNSIIQKIRNGAGVDELMRECRLCRDEAVLLIRLHGSGGA